MTPENPWITWEGGKCPVDPEVQVEARYCDGVTEIALAEDFRWEWCFGGEDGDIIAYRLVSA